MTSMKEKKTVHHTGIGAFVIRVQVERANPLILRDVRVPLDLKGEELLKAVGPLFGMEKYQCRILSGEENVKDQKADVVKLLRQDADVRMILYSSETDLKNGDCVSLRLWENTETQKEDLPDRVPRVIFAAGRNLTRRAGYIGDFNRLQERFDRGQETFELDGEHYDDASLLFSQRKTENALRRIFSPETALPELQRDRTMPMLPLLEKLKMNELKGMADAYGIYYDSTARKPYLVSAFHKKYDRAYIRKFYDEMSFTEFLNLRRFVRGEECEGKDWEDLLPECFNHGFYTDVPRMGPRIAQEIMEYYEEWYGTDQEEAFLQRKYLRAALRTCGNLYGVFDRTRFQTMLEIIAPEVTWDMSVHSFLSGIPSFSLKEDILTLQNGVYYCNKLGTESDVRKLWEIMTPYKDSFYKPNREEAIRLAEDENLFHEDTKGELMGLLSKLSYSGYHGWNYVQQGLHAIQTDLWIDGNAEQAEKTAVRYMDRLRWGDYEEEKEKLKAILTQEAVRIPLVILNGYSERKAPKELKKFLSVYRDEKKEEGTKAKITTVKKKAAVTKVVAIKKKR